MLLYLLAPVRQMDRDARRVERNGAEIYHLGHDVCADPSVVELYHACITQARQPVFYERLGVPDTLDGRFDMLLLHVFLTVRRLKDNQPAQQKLFDMI